MELTVDKNVLHLGDAFDYMNGMEPHSIPMIYADPDYGTGKISKIWSKGFDIDKMFESFYRILKPNGVIVIHAFGPFSVDLINADRKNYKYSWIWDKDRTTGFLNAKKQPLRNHEDILVFYKKQPTYNPQMTEGKPPHSVGKSAIGASMSDNIYNDYVRIDKKDNFKYPRTVLDFPAITGSKKLYPTQKPIGLSSYMIKTYTNEGDCVYSPFTGSGTDFISCMRTNRICVATDRSERAIHIAMKRIKEEEISIINNHPMF